MAESQTKGNLELLLMSVLGRGSAHGYGIIATLRDRSAGEFDFAEGTIYPALHRLERAGLVVSSVEITHGRRRRTYALTAKGRAEFAARRQRWQRFVTTVQGVLA